jgi:hypothetical protein
MAEGEGYLGLLLAIAFAALGVLFPLTLTLPAVGIEIDNWR